MQRFNANIYSSYHGKLTHHNYFCEEQNIRKKHLFLVVNMAFADLFLGAFSLPVYIYDVGYGFRLWTTFVGNVETNKPMLISYMIVDTAFSQALLYLQCS